MELVRTSSANIISAVTEVYHSPLALPILLAVMWRAYAKTLGVTLLLNAFVVAGLAICVWPSSVPSFLDLQNHMLEGAFVRGFPVEARDLISSWQVERRFLSPQAGIFGFAFFAVITTGGTKRRWYKDWGFFIIQLGVLTLLTYAWWFLFLAGLRRIMPTDTEYAKMTYDEMVSVFRRGVEYYADIPVAAAGWAMATWIVGAFSFTFIQRHRQAWLHARHYRIIDRLMVIVLTILILGFALSGFLFLPAYQATLWLLFWIVAYPVALSFTRAKPLQGRNLVEVYKAGLTQIPFIGDLLARIFDSPSKPSDSSTKSDGNAKPNKPPPTEEV